MTARAHLSRIALLLATALIATSCSGSPEDNPPKSDEETVELDQGFIDGFTSTGIRVVSDTGATVHPAASPASGLDFTVEQATILQRQAENGTGTLGATLDTVAETPIPMSALLAAYARGVDTPGAKLAAEMLAPQDLTHPQDVVFPLAVLALFASDAAHAMGGASDLSLSAAGSGEGGLCSAVTDAIYNGVNKLFDALHINQINMPKTGVAFFDGLFQGLADLVVGGINYVVEAVRTLVIKGIEWTVGQLLSLVADVAAVAAIVAEFGTAMSRLRLKVEADPEKVAKGVGGKGNPVKVTVEAKIDFVGDGAKEWPGWFENCAKVAGVDLPPLKPVDERVDWVVTEYQAGLIRESGGTKDKTLKDGGPRTAIGQLDLVSGTEPTEDGEEKEAGATVRVTVHRQQIERIRDILIDRATSLLTRRLPPLVSDLVHTAVSGGLKALTEGLMATFDETGAKAIAVTFHDQDKKKPPKVKPGTHEIWRGTWTSNVYEGSGSFTWDLVRNGTETTGSLSVSGSSCIQGGHIEAKIDGKSVEFGLVKGGRALISFRGTINGDSMSGVYVNGPECGNDAGTWSATH